MLMNRKILFLDVDGTIRDMDAFIPDSAKQAIRSARKRGHLVCIGSGRPYYQIGGEVLDIGFDGIISSSGGYVTLEGKCIRENDFSRSLLSRLLPVLEEGDCMVEYFNHRERIMLRKHEERYKALNDYLCRLYGEKAAGLAEMPRLVDRIPEDYPIEKMLYYSDRFGNEFLKDRFPETALVSLSIPNFEKYGGEITPADTTKAEGVRSLLKASGISKEDAIAFGDSENDLTMFGACGTAVAMGNGTPETRAAADMVTDTVRGDGLYHAFRKLRLI